MLEKKNEEMTAFEFISLGERCHARYHKVDENAPVLLIATGGGKKGSLSDSWVHFPQILKKNGISTIIFDFAGQGLSEGNRRCLTLKKGVQNLVDILDHISKWDWIHKNKLALMGSSFGGNVVLEYLAIDGAIQIRGAIFKSPCINLRESYYRELGDEGMRIWQKAGYSDLTGLAWEVIEDADASELLARLKKITVPLFITHGNADESVPIDQSRKIRDCVGGIADLLEMKDTNHHYSDRNDWDRMAAVHVAWLKCLFNNNGGTE